MFDISQFKQHLYDIDIHLTKIYKCYLKEVDPYDLERNKKLMSAFTSYFKLIEQ